MIKVIVNGACGKMGRTVLQAVNNDKELDLVGAVDIKGGAAVSDLIGAKDTKVIVEDNLQAVIDKFKPDVMVDFTRPDVVFNNACLALKNHVSPVIGTTGLSNEAKDKIDKLAQKESTPAFIAANFAIGAVLLMMMAKEAAKYLPNVEIIELHHDQKLDAPSGTAITTAEMISEVRKPMKQGNPNEKETLPGARGAQINGIPIHSVRLPGYVAHEEVIFGGIGQTLTLRHDSIDRTSFMPGVLLACKKIRGLKGLVRNLDKIM